VFGACRCGPAVADDDERIAKQEVSAAFHMSMSKYGGKQYIFLAACILSFQQTNHSEETRHTAFPVAGVRIWMFGRKKGKGKAK
jgi:hypothetical protein